MAWLNGYWGEQQITPFTSTNPCAEIFISDEKEEKPMTRFQVGQRIRPNPLHRDYNNYKSQHKSNDGTIVKHDGSYIIVKWDNGHQNSYSADMVFAIDESGKEILGENEFSYDLPLLPGQRVTFNPNHPSFNELNRNYGSNTGYIKNTVLSDDDFIKWKTFSHKSRCDMIVDVILDNGKSASFYIKHLLPVDAPYKEISKWQIRNGNTYYLVEGDVESKKRIDDAIITRGQAIRSVTHFNETWRQKILDGIKNFSK